MALFWNLFRFSRTGYRMQTGSLHESMPSMRMLLKLQPGHTNKGVGRQATNPPYFTTVQNLSLPRPLSITSSSLSSNIN